MQIQRRSPRRTQRRRNLARDQPALSHPRNHHASRAPEHQLHRPLKRPRHGPANAVRQRPQRLRLNAHHVLASMFHPLQPQLRNDRPPPASPASVPTPPALAPGSPDPTARPASYPATSPDAATAAASASDSARSNAHKAHTSTAASPVYLAHNRRFSAEVRPRPVPRAMRPSPLP